MICYSELAVDMTDEQAQHELQLQLVKIDAEQDKPLIRRLFKATFKERHAAIALLEDCAVAKLIEQFPLMNNMEFVS